ncbi:DUF58 domain-containing protein [Roseomonas gilardii subsp. gilardii]|uniref:DUF58 domain-containing protein n=1 Tax=Roseomonas gilardii TaxID=257708 RepID=UPI001FFA721C|nr:DUF58 domain-containing protein [Roseomonas gilardii]UPG72533.1 DUF58 domain-containing protein [Roseomonas gilardii subsp. gilardii]
MAFGLFRSGSPASGGNGPSPGRDPGGRHAAATDRAARAEVAAGALPPLLVAAERVAATVMQGVHGRRRPGQGDAFWQFRPFVTGDSVTRMDWRQSAKADRLFVRETEWEAAQTVGLWRDAGPGMDWSGSPGRITKRERAELLLLALGALLLRGGERLRLFGDGRGPVRTLAGRGALPVLAEALSRHTGPPRDQRLPRHARAVLFGDFLAPLEETRSAVSALAAQGVHGHLVQVLDPAEESLPFAGRVRFEALSGGDATLVPRVEGIRDLYAERLAAHRDGLATIARAAGWNLLVHRTDQPPEAALLALWQALAPIRGGGRGGA